MDEKKENWLPWIIAAGAVFMLLRNQHSEQNTAKPTVAAVVRTTLPTIRVAYRSAFLEAANKIEAGEIRDQEAWVKFIADNAGVKQDVAMTKVYKAIDELDLPASFEGKESEIAKINREIAGAW